MIRIAELKIPLIYDLEMLKDIASKRLHIAHDRIERINIVKRAINAIDKQDVYFDMTIDVFVFGDENEVLAQKRGKAVTKVQESFYTVPRVEKLNPRPVVVGCGPAGIFAALILAQAGARPILLERGLDVDSRRQSVLNFWQTGVLDTNSNVQFGEGGAGAFSDGKLKVGLKDPRKMKILNEFVEAGAPPEILFLSKPHIGTDRLGEAVKRIREKTVGFGGEVRFGAAVTDILRREGQVIGVRFYENGQLNELSTDNIILAVGHSARDLFESLRTGGICMEQKPFSMGVRIEHPQALIDKIQYGDFAGHPSLGAADYRLVVHLPNGRGVYTFCMCPGGRVVAAASEDNRLVTNGMSEYARNGRNANTALLVTIDLKELGSGDPLAGIAFQRRIEEAAFAAGGGGYRAPVQRLEDFISGRETTAFGEVLPTYLPGTGFAPVDSYMPEVVAASLRQSISEMEAWMPGFAFPDALITGAETRSSSPVRIVRGESLEAIGIKGLYPCGEGAGYAGGIISAAVDGIRCAEEIIGKVKNL